jgi:hypothetical protein
MVTLEAGILHEGGLQHGLIWHEVSPSVKTFQGRHKKLVHLHRYGLKRFREAEVGIFIFYVENRK